MLPTMTELAAAMVARQEMPPEKGELGPIGPNGKAGLDGENGRNGDPGPKGDTGDRGPVGANGVDGRNGPDGKDGVNGEPSLVWRGPWVRNLQYWADDAVEQDGSSYVCTVATRSKPPSGAWDLLAKRGATGPPGMSRGGGGGGGGSALTVKDEGTVLDTAAASIDFVGDGVTTTNVGHAVTVTVTSGGGSQDLAAVLTVGNDGGALGIVNAGIIAGLAAAGGAGAELTAGDAGSIVGGQARMAGGLSTAGQGFAVVEVDGGNDDDAKGGDISVRGGNGLALSAGGNLSFYGGDGNAGTALAGRVNAYGGAGDGTPGRIGIVSDGITGNIGDVLTAQGDTFTLWVTVIAALIAGGGQAAFVPDPATPEQIRDALVASGLMASV